MARRGRAPASDSRAGAGAEYRSALGRVLAAGYRTAARGVLATVLAASLGAFAALLGAERIFGARRFFPLVAFVVFWGAVAAAVSLRARRLLPARGTRDLAADLDRRLGGVNLLTAALEFSSGGDRTAAYSPYLLDATIRRARSRLAGIDPRNLFAAWARPGWAAAGTILGIVVVIETLFLGADAGRLMRSIADPARSFRRAFLYNLVATSGDRLVLPGDSVVVEAVNFGAQGGEAALHTSTVPGIWSRKTVRGERAIADGLAVTVYRHTLHDVREDVAYAFSAGGTRTREHRVRVVHRPVVNRIAAVLVPPRYAGARPDTLDPLAGKIAALAGTRVELAAETSVTPRSGWIRFASGARLPVRPKPRGFAAAFTVIAADTFVVEIVDSLGYANDRSVSYPVAALADGPPSIEIVAPADGAQLPRTMETELAYRAADDYGVSRVTLRYMRDGKDEGFRETPLRLPPGLATEIEERTVWSLADANVFPGDRILYYLEAADNNTATGPATARTDTRRLVVPSVSEIYARIREDETKRSEDLKDVLEEGREIEKRLRKLSDDLKTEGRLDWSGKRESEAVAEKQRELQEKMREITSELERNLDEMERNRSASREVGEKLEEIRDLMKKIESEDLRAAIESLEKLMREMPAEQLMPAMNQAQMDMRKLLENMDRTIELLKQVLREEKMDEMVRRVDDMLKDQTALRDSAASGDTEKLAERQRDLGEESTAYEKDLERFAKEQADSALAAELERARREMEQSKTSEEMRQAADELSRGDRESAQCSQQSAVDGLLSLFSRMTSCRMSMGLTIERDVAEAIARSTRDLVETSKLQERLVARLGDPGAGGMEDFVRDGLVVKGAVERITASLYEAGRKSLALSPQVFIDLGLARKHIEDALARMDEARATQAAESSARAYLAMNLAAIELLRSSSSMGGGGGGSGKQAMQQLLQQQLSLREQLVQMLERGRNGQWSMEERAGMARLAAEQRAMEDVMRRIAEESRGTNELMGTLDDLAGKMEEIAKSLEEGGLDRELLDRQEQIISRMLDSQRSMRERDYKRERRSTTATDVAPLAPDGRLSPAEERELLLKMIQRGMRERGPAEYEDLIRRYFRALSEKAREER